MVAATPPTETYTLIAVHYTHGGAQANPKVVVLPVGTTVAHAIAELQANVWSGAQTIRLLPRRNAPAFDDGAVLWDTAWAHCGHRSAGEHCLIVTADVTFPPSRFD